MKKILRVCILFILIISLSACTSPGNKEDSTESKENIVTTVQSGQLSSKYIKEDVYYLDFMVETKSIEFTTKDTSLFDYAQEGKSYEITADENNNITKLDEVTVETTNTPAQNAAYTIIEGEEKVDIENYTLLDSFKVDFNKDGKEDEIIYLTDAQKDDKGKVMWDDSQDFILIARIDDRDYTLFHGEIYNGKLTYYVYEEGEVPKIATTIASTANIEFSTFSFTNENKDLMKKTYFKTSDSENVNLRHEYTIN